MDSKENKLYYFIQLELLRLKNLTNIFTEEHTPRGFVWLHWLGDKVTIFPIGFFLVFVSGSAHIIH